MLSSKYTPVDTNDDNARTAVKHEGPKNTSATHGTTSLFPGMRRTNMDIQNTNDKTANNAPNFLIKTGGNALREYNPTLDDDDDTTKTHNNQVISVTVPPNVSPGQMIHVDVDNPAGSGQQQRVEVQIPAGLKAGDTFHVEYNMPSASTNVSTGMNANANAGNDVGLLSQPPLSQRVVTTGEEKMTQKSQPAQQSTYIFAGEQQQLLPLAVPLLPPPAATIYLPPVPAPQPAASASKLVQVNVPPNTPPGTTIHVQIPGVGVQNRTVAAVVPPGNVTQFHVAYDDEDDDNALQPAVVAHQVQSQSVAGQKLVLVQVPPNTPAGTTMHVQVPGGGVQNHNHVIEVVVPPGNVSQFHVAYNTP